MSITHCFRQLLALWRARTVARAASKIPTHEHDEHRRITTTLSINSSRTKAEATHAAVAANSSGLLAFVSSPTPMAKTTVKVATIPNRFSGAWTTYNPMIAPISKIAAREILRTLTNRAMWMSEAYVICPSLFPVLNTG
jgi:hypothetical protein